MRDLIIVNRSDMISVADAVRQNMNTTAGLTLGGIIDGVNYIANNAVVTPVISVNSANGLITATAGTKSSTYQLAFQSARTITPSAKSQIAVSSGYFTGGNVTVASVPTQTKTVTPTSSAQNITPDNEKFLSEVIVNGDNNLISSNIKKGVSIFGVDGNYEETGGDTDIEDAIVTGSLSSYFNNRVTNIGDYAFTQYKSLTTVDFPEVTSIGNEAFTSCPLLSNISFPKATRIGSYAFASCRSLKTINFPEVSRLGSNAFGYCASLTSISFPKANYIDTNAFQRCDRLTSVNFPEVTNIGAGAFNACSSLTTISSPKVTTLGNGAFSQCKSLTSANFSLVRSIGTSAFSYCHSLSNISFPNATSIGSNAFNRCSSLTTVGFPEVTSVGSAAFVSCINLTDANFPKATSIGSYAFSGCRILSSITIDTSQVCTLSNSNAFSSTPYAGYKNYFSGTPYIYVPFSLLTSYKNATNWAYYSSYFSAIGGQGDMIVFAIYDSTYSETYDCQAETGMTWEEWCASDYNTINACVYDDHVYISGTFSDLCISNLEGTMDFTCGSDLIIANHTYYAKD